MEKERAYEATGDTVHAVCCWEKSHNCTYKTPRTHTHWKRGYSGHPDQFFLFQALHLVPPGRGCFSITLLLQGLLLANRPTEVCVGKTKREMEYRKWEVKPGRKETETEISLERDIVFKNLLGWQKKSRQTEWQESERRFGKMTKMKKRKRRTERCLWAKIYSLIAVRNEVLPVKLASLLWWEASFPRGTR